MVKLRTKCCPFCGSEVDTAYRSGGVCVVSCKHCRADGPVVWVEDYLDFADEVMNDEAWNEAADRAKAEAVKKWNCRPPMTDVFPEDLEDYEKTHSAALYGACARGEGDNA